MSYSFGNLTLNDPNLLTTSISIGGSNMYGYTSVTGATGGSYTVAGSNGSSWSNIIEDPKLKGASLKVKGDAEIDGDIKLNGRSMSDLLDKIEQRLALLTPNTELEAEWEELKALGDQYRQLEQYIKEKSKTWDILKRE